MELKPCPFCGGKAEAIQFSAPRTFGLGNQAASPKVWVVRCIKNSCGTLNTFYYDKKLAIDLWNTRAERTCELNGSISWEWHTTSTTFYTHSLSCGHNVTTTEPEPPCYCEECGAKVVES